MPEVPEVEAAELCSAAVHPDDPHEQLTPCTPGGPVRSSATLNSLLAIRSSVNFVRLASRKTLLIGERKTTIGSEEDVSAF